MIRISQGMGKVGRCRVRDSEENKNPMGFKIDYAVMQSGTIADL